MSKFPKEDAHIYLAKLKFGISLCRESLLFLTDELKHPKYIVFCCKPVLEYFASLSSIIKRIEDSIDSADYSEFERTDEYPIIK